MKKSFSLLVTGVAMSTFAADPTVRLITLDPGHFHAGLVQKEMYPQVSPVVHVYAPAGPDVTAHLQRIDGFNTRADSPTHWEEKVFTGPDFLDRMCQEKAGNVVVISGNNRQKTEYIEKAVAAGLNVLADKPMAITPEGFTQLQKTFRLAERKKVLLYDIMTERSEITTILQKELSHAPDVFGELQKGTAEQPVLTCPVPAPFMRAMAARVDQDLPVGNEGAGTVIAAENYSPQLVGLMSKPYYDQAGLAQKAYGIVKIPLPLPGTPAKKRSARPPGCLKAASTTGHSTRRCGRL